MRILSFGTSIVVALLASALASPALAFEYEAPGTRSLGRAGATFAHPDEAMALDTNQAALADIRRPQLYLSATVGLLDQCYDRSGRYTDPAHFMAPTFDEQSTFGAVNTWGNIDFPRVCNGNTFEPGGNLIGVIPIIPGELTFAAGLIAPSGPSAQLYSETIPNPNRGMAGQPDRIPSPVRYQLLESHAIIAHPTIGIGWRPTSWLALGLALEWGFAALEFKVMTTPGYGETPSQDIRTRYQGNDFFVPGVRASAMFTPHPSIDAMIGFRWVDSVGADGTLSLTSGPYNSMATGGTIVNPPFPATFGAALQTELHAAVRYGHRTRGRDYAVRYARENNRVNDGLENETFDVEVAASYVFWSRVASFDIGVPNGTTIQLPTVGMPMNVTVPTGFALQHQWRDQLILRVGGDWNVIPGELAVRAGFSYQTNAQARNYTQVDFPMSARYGFHLGGTLRINHQWDISVAYAHIFQEPITVVNGQLDQIYAQPIGGTMPSKVNNGRYTSDINAFSISGAVHL